MSSDDGARLGAKAAGVFGAQVIGAILGFLLNLVIARFYGPGALGTYSLVGVVATLAGIPMTLGTDKAAAKFIPGESPGNRDSSIISLTMGLAITTAGCALAVAIYFTIGDVVIRWLGVTQHKDVASVAVLSFVIIAAHRRLLRGVYRGVQKVAFFDWLNNPIYKLGVLASLLVLGLLGFPSTVSLLVTMALVGLGVAIFLYHRIFCRYIELSFEFPSVAAIHNNKETITQIFTYSRTLLIVGAISVFLMRTDLIIVSLFTDNEHVGIYQSCYLLASSLALVGSAVNSVVGPRWASGFRANDKEAVLEQFKTVIFWLMLIGGVVGSLLITFSERLLMIFGDEFVAASKPMVILTIGYAVHLGAGPNGELLRMGGGERLEIVNSLVAVCLNALLGILLVPEYGLIGAALGTATAFCVVSVLKTLEIRALFGITFEARRIKIMLVIGVALLVGATIINGTTTDLWYWSAGYAFVTIVVGVSYAWISTTEGEREVIGSYVRLVWLNSIERYGSL